MVKSTCSFCGKKFNLTKKNSKTCNDICWRKYWDREKRKENKFHKENKKSTVSWKIEFKNGIEIIIPQKLVKRQKKYGHFVEMHPDEGFYCIEKSGVLGVMFRMYDGSSIFVEGNKKNMEVATTIDRSFIDRKPLKRGKK